MRDDGDGYGDGDEDGYGDGRDDCANSGSDGDDAMMLPLLVLLVLPMAVMTIELQSCGVTVSTLILSLPRSTPAVFV